jgi:hypothetical protein
MLVLSLLSKLFELILMDFIIDLPSSINKTIDIEYNSILIIINQYTKVSKYILYKKTTSIEDLTDLFSKN